MFELFLNLTFLDELNLSIPLFFYNGWRVRLLFYF
jgi:hypothetical protein